MTISKGQIQVIEVIGSKVGVTLPAFMERGAIQNFCFRLKFSSFRIAVGGFTISCHSWYSVHRLLLVLFAFFIYFYLFLTIFFYDVLHTTQSRLGNPAVTRIKNVLIYCAVAGPAVWQRMLFCCLFHTSQESPHHWLNAQNFSPKCSLPRLGLHCNIKADLDSLSLLASVIFLDKSPSTLLKCLKLWILNV